MVERPAFQLGRGAAVAAASALHLVQCLAPALQDDRATRAAGQLHAARLISVAQAASPHASISWPITQYATQTRPSLPSPQRGPQLFCSLPAPVVPSGLERLSLQPIHSQACPPTRPFFGQT